MAHEPAAFQRVLLVEDEFSLADELATRLRAAGAEVLGPVASVDAALDLIEGTDQLDGAVLDLNLQGEMAYPVADALMERDVPFIFTTGYDQAVIPARYQGVTRCEKPIDAAQITRKLFG